MNEVIHIKVASNSQEFNDAMSVRRSVFVNEKGIDAKLEFDGNDFNASQIVAYLGQKSVGTLRLRYFNDFVKIERCCVEKDFRKTNISEKMMSYAYDFCAQKGYHQVVGTCKKELLPRWQKDGFYPLPNIPLIEQNGMTLIPIYKKLDHIKELEISRLSFDDLNKRDISLIQENTYPLIKNNTAHLESVRQKLDSASNTPHPSHEPTTMPFKKNNDGLSK